MSFTNILGQGRVNQLGGVFINGRPLPPETRRLIILLAEKGVKPCKISRDLRVSHGAVSKILNRYNETGSIMPGQIGGNPRSRLSIQVVEHSILALIKENPTFSPTDIRSALIERGYSNKHNAPTISSISRYMRSRGFRKSFERQPMRSNSAERRSTTIEVVRLPSSSGDGPGCSKQLMNDSDFLVVADDDEEEEENESSRSSSDNVIRGRTDVSGYSGDKTPDSFFCSFLNFSHSDNNNNNSLTVEDDEGNSICKRNRRRGLSNYSIETILGTPSTDGAEKPADLLLSTPTQRHSSDDVDFALPLARLSSPSTSPPLITVTQQPHDVARCSNNSSNISSSASSSFSSSAPQHSSSSSDEENSCGVRLPLMEERSTVGDGDERASGPSAIPTTTHHTVVSAQKSATVAEARRNRTSFSAAQLKVLEGVFERAIYPSVAVKEQLMAVTGLDEDKIITWFSNRRARKRKAALEWCRTFVAQLTAMCSINEAQQQQLSDALMNSLNGGGGGVMPLGAVTSLNHQTTTFAAAPILASIMQQQQQPQSSSPISHHQQMWLQQHSKIFPSIPATNLASTMMNYRFLNNNNNSLLLAAAAPHAAVLPQMSSTIHTPGGGGALAAGGGNLAQALLLQLQQQQQQQSQSHESNEDEAVLRFLKQFPEVAVQEKLQ